VSFNTIVRQMTEMSQQKMTRSVSGKKTGKHCIYSYGEHQRASGLIFAVSYSIVSKTWQSLSKCIS